MVATSFQIFAMSALASVLIDEFALSRFELGLIGSINTAVGAVTAPATGSLTDRLGARWSTVISQAIAALGFVLMAVAQSVLLLIVSAAVLGIPQGWGNPATNSLIAERVQPGNRGRVTGIKQSGVQLGIFLAGITLPGLADVMGWRSAIGLYAAIFGVLALLPIALPESPAPAPNSTDAAQRRAQGESDETGAPYDMRAVRLIAIYAFLMGLGGGAIARFLALFAEEEAGLSNTTAGFVLALSGLAGIFARVVAGQLAEHRIEPLPLLVRLALVASVVGALLLVVLEVGAWLLWPIALLYAVGHAAWNAVAMLAIIVGVDQQEAGRASGTVMVGFLGGLALGAPLAGLIVDETGSYQLVWWATLVLSALSAAVAQFATRPVASVS